MSKLTKLRPSAERTRIMRAIRSGGNKTTEARARAILMRMGISGWKVRLRSLTGTPDFAFIKGKVAIFIDGCFWHGCPECGRLPKSNRSYWLPKIEGNRRRDSRVSAKLKKTGWSVVRFWEHQLRHPSFNEKLIKAAKR